MAPRNVGKPVSVKAKPKPLPRVVPVVQDYTPPRSARPSLVPKAPVTARPSGPSVQFSRRTTVNPALRPSSSPQQGRKAGAIAQAVKAESRALAKPATVRAARRPEHIGMLGRSRRDPSTVTSLSPTSRARVDTSTLSISATASRVGPLHADKTPHSIPSRNLPVPTCKERPRSSRPSGSGGRSRRFVPWCS